MYLDFKVKAKVDLANLTFSADAAENFYEDNTVDIQGGIIKKEAPINVSNLSLIDPKTNTATRVGYQIVDGKKVRIAKKSGEEIK